MSFTSRFYFAFSAGAIGAKCELSNIERSKHCDKVNCAAKIIALIAVYCLFSVIIFAVDFGENCATITPRKGKTGVN